MKSFPEAPLGEIASLKQWGILAKSEMSSSGFPVYGANGVIGHSPRYTHAEPVVLVGCRGTIGSVHITVPRSYATGNAMALDNLDESRIDRSFLARFLRWRGFSDVTSGSSQPQLTRRNLATVKIPLPPMGEQRRIAAILDAADAIRDKRRQTIAHLDALPRTLLPSGIEDVLPLGEFATIHAGGRLGLTGRDFAPVGVPAFGAGGQNGLLATAEYTDTDAVILSSIGARCGKCFLAQGSWTTLANTQVILPSPDIADAVYLWFALNDESRWPRSGSAQPFIKPTDVKRHRVPLPPIESQKKFTREVAVIWHERAKAERALALDDELFASLQSRAFRGEL